MISLTAMSARALARAIREKRVRAEEAVRWYLARIEKLDGPGGLNAVCQVSPDAIAIARDMDAAGNQNQAPLFGVPILVKDNIDVRGMPTTAGSRALQDNIAREDAPIIARLRENGAIILGKTNMTEFANYTTQNMPGGYSSFGGQVKSAYGGGRSPSGSSAGSAVAVSAGLCAAAIGTDTSFSVVGCATENGVTGLKPPAGTLPGDGIVPIAHTLDSAGVLSRTLDDALLVYSCMRSEPLAPVSPIPPERLRLAVNTFGRDQVSGAQMARYEALFGRLRARGAAFTEITQPYCPRQRDVMRCEFRPDLEAYLSRSAGKRKTLREIVDFYTSDPGRMMKYGITYLQAALDDDGAAYPAAMLERARLRPKIMQELAPFDACVMTGPTNIMHFTGLPSLALKLCDGDDGAPRGMILYGADEARLYGAALTIESLCEPVSQPALCGI